MIGAMAARWLGRRPPRYRDLLATAERDDVVFLPHIEPGRVGNALALVGLALGVVWARWHSPGGETVVGWVALALVFAGMLIQTSLRRIDTGWQVDLRRRLITPVGCIGEPVTVSGNGFNVTFAAAEKKRCVVIDLCQDDKGRVVRLFETPGSVRLADHRALSGLADVLARRLQVRRDGLTF